MEKELEFKFERETKGAVRYFEVDDEGRKIDNIQDAVIGTIYIRKSALDGKVPDKIKLLLRY